MTTVYFDFETSGLLPSNPNIQLAALAVNEQWEELETYEAKIQFDIAKADPEALKMNHFNTETWKELAIPVPLVVSTFSAFLKRHASIEMVSKRTGAPYSVARLAGHNAATFDGPRLKDMYARDFLPAHPQVLDTLQLALWYFLGAENKPDSLRLEKLCQWFEIELTNAHDALADVRGSVAIAKAMTCGFHAK